MFSATATAPEHIPTPFREVLALVQKPACHGGETLNHETLVVAAVRCSALLVFLDATLRVQQTGVIALSLNLYRSMFDVESIMQLLLEFKQDIIVQRIISYDQMDSQRNFSGTQRPNM